MEVIAAISHLDNVNNNLAVQCALLHDVIEDTEYTYDDIRSTFGIEVTDGVNALTKNVFLSTKFEQMKDSIIRIKQQPKEVWMVKLADRITNLSAPPHYWTQQKKIKYQKEARYILDQLGSADKFLAERLSNKIDAYQIYI